MTKSRRVIEECPLVENNHLSPDKLMLDTSAKFVSANHSNSIIITVTTHNSDQHNGIENIEQTSSKSD